MPRTTCAGSNSGCSSEACPFLEDMRRPQSVLDFVEEAPRFAAGCFAEGDDADFIVRLCVGNGDRHTCQKPQGDEALFSIGKAIILVTERQAFEDAWSVHEIEAVFLEIDGAFALGPGETHAQV
jgi:hypothetical protein